MITTHDINNSSNNNSNNDNKTNDMCVYVCKYVCIYIYTCICTFIYLFMFLVKAFRLCHRGPGSSNSGGKKPGSPHGGAESRLLGLELETMQNPCKT